ncbi:hypothetical protein OGAPHI_001610 [Ogataea philodendri]|uniref:Uncharacterized protein n=1 Tax=Ogataea philodendri TaxID=1378263 RepID=A0A9P8PDJ1_9ASCO|nr:uncharacterized protein OGAPHI_001610 [Ogataea philodendri]KAH3669489.1 hypothetical protein OGAPHI_001610 [Ogataea philodendri]
MALTNDDSKLLSSIFMLSIFLSDSMIGSICDMSRSSFSCPFCASSPESSSISLSPQTEHSNDVLSSLRSDEASKREYFVRQDGHMYPCGSLNWSTSSLTILTRK